MMTPIFTREFVEQDVDGAVEVLNRSYYDLVAAEIRLKAATAASLPTETTNG